MALYRVIRAYKTCLEDHLEMGDKKHRPTLYWEPGKIVIHQDGTILDGHVPQRGEIYFELVDGKRIPINRKHGHVYIYLNEDSPLELIKTVIEEVYEKHLSKIHEVLLREGDKDLRIFERNKHLEALCDGRVEAWTRACKKVYEKIHTPKQFLIESLRNQIAKEAYERVKRFNQHAREGLPRQIEKLRKEIMDERGPIPFIKIARLQRKEEQLEREAEVANLSEEMAKELLAIDQVMETD
ncbi:MAG: hypothetical protein H3Z52_12720 [archaeon]|nr:hypothetical protein [archaeon]MCP8321781.1 hypothetical protein [archaeon]